MSSLVTSSIPRYREIADQIQDEIASGKWSIGQKLAPEQALASQYEVSRFTIREAMSLLQENGLISRQRRLGTVVIATHPVDQMVQNLGSMDELLQYAPQTRLKNLRTTMVEADVALAQMLPCSVGTHWARIETIRIEAKRSPVCWTDIYVPAEFSEISERIGKDATPAFRMMEETYGLFATDINAELLAGSLSQRKAEALEVVPGSPALIIVRRYRDRNGRLFEVSVSEHPAGRFSYSVDLQRKAGNTLPHD
jgi:GntR family transcriptional regulator